MPAAPDQPTNSAALSLVELQRQLLRRAGALHARAQQLRERGETAAAQRISGESTRLRVIAHTIRIDRARRPGKKSA